MRVSKTNGQQPVPPNAKLRTSNSEPITVNQNAVLNEPVLAATAPPIASANYGHATHTNETGVIEQRISGKAFVGHFLTLSLLVALALTAWTVINGFIFPILGLALSPFPFLILWAYMTLATRATVYRLHPERLEVDSGILSRRIENIDLFRVRDVGLRQSLWGRMLDFGDLYIHSTDSSTPDLHVRGISDPRGYYSLFRDRVGNSRANSQTMIVEQGGSLREF